MRTINARMLALATVLAAAATTPLAADYMTHIEYRQAIEQIVNEQDLNHGGWSHKINAIAESGNGLKVCFWTLASKPGQPNERHFWICNSDGSNLRDITPAWDVNENPRWPRLNHDGSRMFYVAFYHNGLRYIDTTSGAKVDAVPAAGDLDFRNPYVINSTGTRAFFMDWNPDATGCARGSIAWADVPGTPVPIFTLANLPFDDYCNRNRLAFLGAADTGRVAVAWKIHDHCSDCTSMFLGGPGAPLRVPDEQANRVYALQDLPHRQVSRSGHRVLYHSGMKLADDTIDNRLELLEPDAGRRHVLVAHGTGLAMSERPCISPCGGYVRYNDPLGAYATRMVLAADGHVVSIRDTLSYHHTPLVSPWTLSDMCEGGYRWYGYHAQDWGAKQNVWRFELNYDQTGGGPGNCPIVQRIGWSGPMLLKDDSTKITVYVAVTDPQGLADIDSVGVVSLIDYGRETAVWYTRGRAPLSSGGDMGWASLSDEGPAGNKGDEIAGDGVYTFHGFWTRSSSDFWSHYAAEGLPIKVPIRVFVKDKRGNYMIVDTQLSVTDSADDADDADDSGGDGGDGGADGSDGQDGTDGSDDADGGANGGGDTSGGVIPTGGMCPSTALLTIALTVCGAICLRPRRRR